MIARKYCIDRIEELKKDWTNKTIGVYKEICKGKKELNFTDLSELFKKLTFEEINELSIKFSKTYPKYDASMRIGIIQAILNEIEAIEIDSLSSQYQIEQAVDIAVHKARMHYAVAKTQVSGINLVQIYNDENQLFYNYLNGIKEDDLEKLIPIPYRKVLKLEEVVKIKETFNNCWLKRMWSSTDNCSGDIAQIETDCFFEKISSFDIANVLRKHGVNRICEIDTCNLPPISYSMDIALLDIQSKTGDIFWCSENMDWGIFRHHEGIIYICSEWLINEFQSICPSLRLSLEVQMY